MRYIVRERDAPCRSEPSASRELASRAHRASRQRNTWDQLISLAELRSGHAVDNWGPKRVARAEATIAAYLWFPLDLDVVEKCAGLRAASKKGGWGVGDNDLWIAATAQSRGCAVVSCDAGFCRIEGIDLIYLPGRAGAPPTCP